LFSAYQTALYEKLAQSRDKTLAAIGAKSYKEVVYHLRWSSEWVIRLGDGTEESHTRMNNALDELWKFTGELHTAVPYERETAAKGISPDLSTLRPQWEEKVKEVFDEAGISYPPSVWMQTGGKEGRHTEHLGYVLAEMQFLQRAYPGCEW
jgi:ring-1,2-phenylacetyl-CoA epoxidase subunit PaaC